MPHVTVNATTAGVFSGSWDNPSGIISDDDNYATADCPQATLEEVYGRVPVSTIVSLVPKSAALVNEFGGRFYIKVRSFVSGGTLRLRCYIFNWPHTYLSSSDFQYISNTSEDWVNIDVISPDAGDPVPLTWLNGFYTTDHYFSAEYYNEYTTPRLASVDLLEAHIEFVVSASICDSTRFSVRYICSRYYDEIYSISGSW